MASPTTDRRLGLVGNTALKAPCDLATTANITLSGEQSIDGTTTSSSRVFVKNQTTTADNGIYDTSSGSWTRARDFDGSYDVVTGTIITVTGGSANSHTVWLITNTGTITIGTTGLTFASAVFSDASSVGFLQAGTNAVARTLQDKARDHFSVLDFMTTAEMADVMARTATLDVTVAVQAAITAALLAKRGLCVDGLCYITASLNIDRLVDTQTSVFRIFAKGSGQGFKVNDGVTLFDTTLAYTTYPVSDYIRFDGVHFEEKTPATGTSYVINKKFLRIKFQDCHFEGIKCVDASATTAYLQSWGWHHCTIQHWTNGWFVDTAGCFDVSFTGQNVIESGVAFFRSYDTSGSRATYGFRFMDNLAESNTSTILSIDGSRGVIIAGNYFEGNGTVALPTIDLSVGTLQESGIALMANFFGNHAAPNAAAYNIKWGEVKEGVSFGNFALTNLHDNSGAPATFNLTSLNDQANGTLWSTPRGNGVAALAFNQATAASGSGVFAIDSSKYNFFQLIVGNATTAGIGTPTNAVFGQEFTVQLWNNVGANITAFSYTAIYKPPTWTNLAANTTRSMKFWYDGTNWRVVTLLDAPT